jgi:predicted enzyme related to lactoylglutathione lyase
MKCIFRFDCIFYYVSDLERSIRFYHEILGLSLLSCDVVARFEVDGVLVELVPAEEDSQLTGNGNARLTLAVGDIQSAAANLEEAGVTVSEIHQVQNGVLASFYDTDGNELVLWQYA